MSSASTAIPAFTYQNTNTSLPGWVPNAFANQKRGCAYETDHHFVHFYAIDFGQYVLSTGLTVTEKRDGERLEDWADRVFGARNFAPLTFPAGTVVDSVWRPGLFDENQIFQALGTDRFERRAAEQSLYVLVERLTELMLYIEPEGTSLDAYGLKSRELLILACTEVENTWAQYVRRAGVPVPSGRQGFTTNEYVRLRDPLHLAEFQISLVPYGHVAPFKPFDGWSPASPTQSLAWYDAYNQTKHDRAANLKLATLRRCIEAVAANVVLFCVRYSPHPLYHQTTPVASLVNHWFAVELVGVDPSTFYVPLVELPTDWRDDLICVETREYLKPWEITPLVI